MRYKADTITMQVIRYALEEVADEMGYTLVRTSRSTIIKEIMDISCAVFDREGRTVAQAHHAPMLLTAFEIAMKEVAARFPPERLRDGDLIACNDPYLGGQHLMDVQLFAPVFLRNELIGWVAALAHQQDMGGAAPGGVAGGMTEIFMEGLRLPMVKLYKAGKEDPELFGLIASNIRIPDKTLADIRAQASACFVGARRLKEIAVKYGVDVLSTCTAMLLDYSEARIRQALREFPDGALSGEDWIDNDGITDQPIKVQVNIEKRRDEVVVDFDGTSGQVRGNINRPVATTYAAVYYGLIAIADPRCPANSGCYRPITIRTRPGLIVDPRPPSAVAARTNTSQKIVEATMKAFAGVVPDRVMAGSHGQISTLAFSGFHLRTGKRFVYTDIQGGGAGGLAGKDPRDGQDSHLARFMNTPIEAAELEYPIRIERYEFLPDSGGPGRWRGALGLRRDVRCLADGMVLARYADRQEFAPFGLLGGKDGTPGRLLLNPDTERTTRLKAKGMDVLARDDVVSMRQPGGGGYGPPRERDPDRVAQDVRDDKVSAEAAVRDYRVVVDPVTYKVDRQATAALRGCAGRGETWAPTP
ncbi:MAG: hydantoinase B/oxoprolinase family protein [Acidobacteriota bacterium]